MGRDSTVRADQFSEVKIQRAGLAVAAPQRVTLNALGGEQFRYVFHVAPLSQQHACKIHRIREGSCANVFSYSLRSCCSPPPLRPKNCGSALPARLPAAPSAPTPASSTRRRRKTSR